MYKSEQRVDIINAAVMSKIIDNAQTQSHVL